MKFTEQQLKLYAAPLSDTENQKCLHAIKEIRDALKTLGYSSTNDSVLPLEADTYAYSATLKKSYSNEEIQIFIQGSYANNTCVRGESDVDIAIIRRDKYEYAFGDRFVPYVAGFDKNAEAKVFKDTVERVLRAQFPYCVHRKNKSIKVDGNTYRKQADSVPSFGMRYFNKSALGNYSDYVEGITIYADDGEIINNFPKQHIVNGKRKNVDTNHYYKKMVRIMKKIRYLMEDWGYSSASNVSSFGLESLMWNLPDDLFKRYTTYKYEFGEIVNYLYSHKNDIDSYKEANGIKVLCSSSTEVMNYRNFIEQLYAFYEYDI